MQHNCEMRSEFNALIAGGGAVGSALALTLAREGLHVGLIDSASIMNRRSAEFDGRAFALSLSSCRYLEWLGFGGLIEDEGQPILSVAVADGRPENGAWPVELVFDRAELQTDNLGRIIEARHLNAALAQAVETEPGVAAYSESRISRIEKTGGMIATVLEDGNQLEAAVLIGCDGRSSLAAASAGITRTTKDYRQSALVFSVNHEIPHMGTARQLFMATGPIAILPMLGNSSSVVWTENAETAAWLFGLEEDDFLEQLRPRFGKSLGEISLSGKRFLWPLALNLADSIAGDRIALAGDAAHVIHPLAGQGLNLGLRDAATLGEVLVQAARRGEDIGQIDVLERYQRQRRFDSASMAAATDAFNFMYSFDSDLARLTRQAGMAAIAKMPWLRRAAMREAAGVAGDLPAPMRNRPI